MEYISIYYRFTYIKILTYGKISNLRTKSCIGTWDVHFFCVVPICTKISNNVGPIITCEVARKNASSNELASIPSEICTSLESGAATRVVCLLTGVGDMDVVVVDADDNECEDCVLEVLREFYNDSNNSIASRWHNDVGHVGDISLPIVISEDIGSSS